MDGLAKKIKEAAYLEGHFVLRSGRVSNYYLDKYLFETRPDILRAIAKRLKDFVTPDIDLIAGAELGGVPLATALSLETGLPFVIIRNKKKDYGTSKDFEGQDPRGKTVILLEDIATTGGQVIEAANTLRSLGADVKRIVAVIDRKEGAEENIKKAGFEFASLFTKDDLGI